MKLGKNQFDEEKVVNKIKKYLKKYTLKDTVNLILETEKVNKKEIYKFITGIRVVDVTKYTSVMHRLEFWVSDEEKREEIQSLLVEDFDITTKLSYRSHKNMKEI